MGGKKKQEAIARWKVLLSTTLIQSVTCGIIESYGALFVPIMKTLFPKDPVKSVKAALIGSLGSGLMMGFSPASSWLSKELGVLVCAILGGLIVFMATFTASFSTSFISMALTYGVVFGTGCSILFISNSIIISQHFGDESTVAFGLLGFGNGVMNSIMPHIMAFAVDSIGLSGAIRTISLIFCPIIFLPFYWKEIDQDAEKKMKGNPKVLRMPGTLGKYSTYGGDDKSNTRNTNQGNKYSKKLSRKKKDIPDSFYYKDKWEEEFFEYDMIPFHSTHRNCVNQSNVTKSKTADNTTASSIDTLSSTASIENPPILAQIKNYFKPLKNKGFFNLAISMVVASLGYQVANVHIVNYSADLSLSGNAQLFLTCMGAASATGPLVNPLFVDKCEEHVSKFRIFQIFILGYGISVTFLPLVGSYYTLMCICALIGYFDGSFSTLIGPLIIELIGVEGAGDAIGIYYGCIALSVTIAAPLAGFLFDTYQSYAIPFFTAGILFLFGGFMLSFTHKTTKFEEETTEVPQTTTLENTETVTATEQ